MFTSPYATAGGTPLVRGLGIGTFAEAALVPELSVVKIDPAVPLDLASLVGCALATGVGAVIRTANLRAGSTVAVIGCGGVGLSVVQGARLSGAAAIVAVDRLSNKLDMAQAMGATATVDSSAVDPVGAVRDLTDGLGVDVAFEVVGRSETIAQAFAMARRGGTAVMVGAGSPEDPVTFSAMELFADAKSIVGCVYGSTDPDRDFPLLVGLIEGGQLDAASLVSRRVGLDDVNEAFEAMVAGEVARSVIVFDRAGS